MRTRSNPRAMLVVAALGGCSSDSSDSSSGSSNSSMEVDESGASEGASTGAAGAEGTVTLTFSVTHGVRTGPTLVDPLVGPVYGGIFLTSDVTLAGPADGVSPVIAVEVEVVDLLTADVATATYTSDPLPPGDYTFLGMLDVDGNFDASGGRPDSGDPITLTGQSFEVVAGQDTAFTAIFEVIWG
jgi:hypothetical protein